MKSSSALIGVLIMIMMMACDSSTRKTPGGMEYRLLKAGSGEPATAGQLVVFNYRMVDSSDSVWVDTYDRGLPEVISPDPSRDEASMDEFQKLLGILAKGDSVTFDIPVGEFFRNFVKAPAPPTIDTTRTISTQVTIEEILSQEEFQTFRTEAIEKYEAKMELKKAKQLAEDTVAIDKYLAEKGINAQRTASGMRYVITKPGSGPLLTSGQTASVHYSGYLLDGRYFDSSEKAVAEQNGIYNPMREPYAPFEVAIDRSSVISGWHDALKHMKKGMRATFYIPSTLAYGPQRRSELIGENTILVFDMEVVDVTQ